MYLYIHVYIPAFEDHNTISKYSSHRFSLEDIITSYNYEFDFFDSGEHDLDVIMEFTPRIYLDCGMYLDEIENDFSPGHGDEYIYDAMTDVFIIDIIEMKYESNISIGDYDGTMHIRGVII